MIRRLLNKYQNRISQKVFPIDLVIRMCREKVIHESILHEVELAEGETLLIHGSLFFGALRNTVYQDHLKLKSFAKILLKSDETASLGFAIDEAYGKILTIQYFPGLILRQSLLVMNVS